MKHNNENTKTQKKTSKDKKINKQQKKTTIKKAL